MKSVVLIDTDPGVDDALAILDAMLSPTMQVCAITTVHGNTSLKNAHSNLISCLRVLSHHHSDTVGNDEGKLIVQVAQGADRPMHQIDNLNFRAVNAEEVHGGGGLGGMMDADISALLASYPLKTTQDPPVIYTNSPRNAVDEILFQLNSLPDKTLSIVMLGPLTNLALALRRTDSLQTLRRVKQIYIMGGCIHHPVPGGNITPTAEFNFYVDPLAASIVLDSGLPITLVPLDVTETVRLKYTSFTDMVVDGMGVMPDFVTKFIAGLFNYMSGTRYNHDPLNTTLEESSVEEQVDNSHHQISVAMHDPLCMGIFIDPSIVKRTIHARVQVESTIGSLTQGMCIIDGRRWRTVSATTKSDGESDKKVTVVMSVDGKRFFTRFMKTLFGVEWEESRHAWSSPK